MSGNAGEIEKEAERLEEDALYAEKQHFSMATVWATIHLGLGIPSAVFAALAGISALNAYSTVAAAFAVASAVLTALLTFLNPAKTGSEHHQSGIRYSELRGKLRRLRLLDVANSNDGFEALRQQLETLAAEKSEIMKGSPHIGGLAYRLGKKSILNREHEYRVDPDRRSIGVSNR